MFGARPAATRAQWEAQQREMMSATELPAFEGLMFDDEDRLWIRRYDRTQRARHHWMAIDASGKSVTNASLPLRCTAHHARNGVLAATCLDDDDRPSVALFSLK
jgi:hypothetical protein